MKLSLDDKPEVIVNALHRMIDKRDMHYETLWNLPSPPKLAQFFRLDEV